MSPLIRSFKTFGEFLEYLHNEVKPAQLALNEQAKPWQIAIDNGDYVIAYDPDWKTYIYGHINNFGDTDIDNSKFRKFDRWYSIYCPDGELGSFEQARKEGWPNEQ